jgi:hypothetical protein
MNRRKPELQAIDLATWPGIISRKPSVAARPRFTWSVPAAPP